MMMLALRRAVPVFIELCEASDEISIVRPTIPRTIADNMHNRNSRRLRVRRENMLEFEVEISEMISLFEK